MANSRRQNDVMKLMLTEYEIEIEEDSGKTSIGFLLKNFKGPVGTPYEGGVFTISVLLPPEYPFKSPSIGFRTRIFHPNIDERSGTVCLDVINQTWSPMYDLRNIFDIFLPQLLTYGNASDPLNGEAAALMLRDPEKFKQRVKDYIRQYATPPTVLPKTTTVPLSTAGASSSSSSSSTTTSTTRSNTTNHMIVVSVPSEKDKKEDPPTTVTNADNADNNDTHHNGTTPTDDHHTSRSSSVASNLSELSNL